MILAALEAGGTKFACALVRCTDTGERPAILAETTLPTIDPASTLDSVRDFFVKAGEAHGKPERMGIGCFGPIDPLPGSPTWGRVLKTPKKGWSGVDVAGYFGRAMGIPVFFDTDVNAAALGEHLWGVARGVDDFIYLTVGTGIGGGAFVDGRLLHGAGHPEMGHIRLARAPGDDFSGTCPFHDGCLEGLACGPAVEGRWGMKGADIPESHAAWALEAGYLAQGIASLALVLAPRLVILGGGVGAREDVLRQVRLLLPGAIGGYRADLATIADAERFVKSPGLGGRSGILGAAGLALPD